MSVQLVLCVADSVWRGGWALAWLGSACPRRTRIAPARVRRRLLLLLLLLLLLAVLSFHCRQSQFRPCRDRS